MSEVKDGVLGSVVLIERLMPRLKPNTRDTLKRSNLAQVSDTVGIILQQLKDDCNEPTILTPLLEVVKLIDTLTAEDTFIETDAESKHLIVDRIQNATEQLYLFAGKFYMEYEFTYSMTKVPVLTHIVDCCMANGYYFGYDKVLRAEGAI